MNPLTVLLIGEDLVLESMSLRHDGWGTVHDVPSTALANLAHGTTDPIDLVILDLEPGSAASAELRSGLQEAGYAGPVLYLTDQEHVSGVTGIGDAFLARPYSLEQLAAALRALARTTPTIEDVRRPATTIRYGSLVIDEDALGAEVDGAHLQLTGTEFEFLRYLARFPNRVHSKANILDRVWPIRVPSVRSTVVELYASYLRKKLPDSDVALATVRGAGYRLTQGR
ncbi:DNA-binding response regulator [Leucobacter zeae]|nr:DNA-binding response regulator [Leucobacter zeae]